MTYYSHSRTSLFEQCPYRYKLRYIDKLETLENFDAKNPLALGTYMHEAIQGNVESAVEKYLNHTPKITENNILESIKLEVMATKALEVLPKFDEIEIEAKHENFIGYIDALVEVDDGVYDMYDFKYANPRSADRYVDSRQLHVYAYNYEMMTGHEIRRMYYVLIPKTFVRQKNSENEFQFRQRLYNTLEDMEVQLLEIKFDINKVDEFYEIIEQIESTDFFDKNVTKLCSYCEFEEYCLKGRDYMLLPSAERRDISGAKKRRMWIYGDSFIGKTTMLDNAPNPLNLNTDGNIEFVTMPFVKIADEVVKEGRQVKRKFAWEVFKDVLEELETGDNNFKTIIIDLVEDVREACRAYMYDKLDIQHESDGGYGKGWDMVRHEFLSTMRRFFNLDYENLVIVSHAVTSEINRKNGLTITTISPNIQDGIAVKLAGMVDIVALATSNDDNERVLQLKQDPYIFGGGRLKNHKRDELPLSWEELIKVYDDIEGGQEEVEEEEVKEEPQRRRRRRREEAEDENA